MFCSEKSFFNQDFFTCNSWHSKDEIPFGFACLDAVFEAAAAPVEDDVLNGLLKRMKPGRRGELVLDVDEDEPGGGDAEADAADAIRDEEEEMKGSWQKEGESH